MSPFDLTRIRVEKKVWVREGNDWTTVRGNPSPTQKRTKS